MSNRIKPKERALRFLRDEYPRSLRSGEVARCIRSGSARTNAVLRELVEEGTVRMLSDRTFRAEAPPMPNRDDTPSSTP